jgi:hypothetical protein
MRVATFSRVGIALLVFAGMIQAQAPEVACLTRRKTRILQVARRCRESSSQRS